MLGILCGLESEELIARTVTGALVECGGATPEISRGKARKLIERGATRLMSFGIAGALTPEAKLGDLYLGTRVVSPKGEWTCDKALTDELAAAIPFAKLGGVYGSEVLVETVQEKARLGQTGCSVVDMESQCLAEVAGETGLPLLVVRTVCDDATMNVPNVVHVAVDNTGRVNNLKAIMYLMAHPFEWPDVVRVMRGTNGALASLERAAPLIRGA